MPGLWVREAKTAPIGALYAEKLDDRDVAFIYFGWAGIILRTKNHAVAFDFCQKNFKRGEVKALEHLGVQCYGHTHWDHWHAPLARAILKQTDAPILVEPAILDERGSIPVEDLTAVRPGEPLKLGDLTVRGVVGIHPRPITMFHVCAPELRVFHGGDSGHVSLAGLSAEIAFVPTGMPSPSCSPESEVAMARDLDATVAIAVHGSDEDMKAFRTLTETELPGTQVVIPKPCELVRLALPG